ncbi:MAG: site-2 protease family protein [Candidatus Limnocylindrales bacterium]
MDQPLVQALVAVGVILLVAFPVHEFSHALAAFRLGDSTARYMGRLTLDPRVHFDPIGGGMLALSALLSQGGFFFGYAKPTPVNPANLEGGRRGEALVALAGPLSTLVLAALVAVPLRLIASSDELLFSVIGSDVGSFFFGIGRYFVLINVFLFIFNLLPIPPLDGWKVLTGLVDARTAYSLRQVEQYAFFLIIAVFFFGGRIIGPIGIAIYGLLLGDRFV